MEPKIILGGCSTDERGVVRYVNDFDFSRVRRFYTIENHKVGYVRAWHGHRSEEKFVYVASGVAMIGAADMHPPHKTWKFILSATHPQILYIPPGYANGSMSLVPNTLIVHFSTTTLEESLEDDIRFPADHFDWIWRIVSK